MDVSPFAVDASEAAASVALAAWTTCRRDIEVLLWFDILLSAMVKAQCAEAVDVAW
jgi:hypothetical protein